MGGFLQVEGFQTLLQAQAHHAGGGAEVVDVQGQGRQVVTGGEQPVEEGAPARFAAIDRGGHPEGEVGVGGFEEDFEIPRGNPPGPDTGGAGWPDSCS